MNFNTSDFGNLKLNIIWKFGTNFEILFIVEAFKRAKLNTKLMGVVLIDSN